MMHKKGGGSAIGYHTHYAVDGGKARIILTALVTPSEVMDNQPMLDLLWHSRFRWQLSLEQVTGDTKYGTAENIVAIEEAGLRAYIPLTDYDKRSPLFGKQQFSYNSDRDVYICPGGEELPLLHPMYVPRVYKYQAEAATCNGCALKAKCTDSDNGRSVTRSFDEEYLERVRSYQTTEPYKRALRKRKVWVEPLFGESKAVAWNGALPAETLGEGEHRGAGDGKWAESETAAELAWLGAALVAGRGNGSGASSRLLVEFHAAGVDFPGSGAAWMVIAFHHRHDVLHGDGAGTVSAEVFQQFVMALRATTAR